MGTVSLLYPVTRAGDMVLYLVPTGYIVGAPNLDIDQISGVLTAATVIAHYPLFAFAVEVLERRRTLQLALPFDEDRNSG